MSTLADLPPRTDDAPDFLSETTTTIIIIYEEDETMPGTVDDFVQRFGEGGNVDENEAAQYHERFASNAPEDQDFDSKAYSQGATEYLGQLPDDQFKQAARASYSQMPPEQKQGLLSSLMTAVESRGANLGSLGSMLGLSSTDPQQMNSDDYARVANYARTQHPEAFQQVVQDKPWWLKAMGHPVLMGVLGAVASKLVQSHTR